MSTSSHRFARPVAVLAMLALAAPPARAQQHPLRFEDFVNLRSVSDPQPSRDGQSVLYAVRTADLAANRRSGRTWIVSTASGAPRPWPAAATRSARHTTT